MSERMPSKRYQELVAVYRDAHENGLTWGGKFEPKVFLGYSLLPHVQPIRDLLLAAGARTLLDYGCGKASLYKAETFDLDGETIHGLQAYWGLDAVSLFDPGVAAYSDLPDGPFDAVISTDVLEHVDEADIDYVLEDIFSRARKMVYMNISVRPAAKNLPNGENAHATVQPPEWWKPKLEAAAANYGVAYCCAFEGGAQMMEVVRSGC